MVDSFSLSSLFSDFSSWINLNRSALVTVANAWSAGGQGWHWFELVGMIDDVEALNSSMKD